ncbi:MAG: hypothetical protein V9F04_05405 [Dermatophilaceae bacterium]
MRSTRSVTCVVVLVAEAELGVEEEVLENGELLDEQIVLAHVADHAADAVALGVHVRPR